MKKDYTYDEFSEFEAIYQDLYNKNINKLEKIRRNVKIRTIIQSIFIAFVCIQMENFGTENFIVNKQLGLFSILIVVVLLYFMGMLLGFIAGYLTGMQRKQISQIQSSTYLSM